MTEYLKKPMASIDKNSNKINNCVYPIANINKEMGIIPISVISCINDLKQCCTRHGTLNGVVQSSNIAQPKGV